MVKLCQPEAGIATQETCLMALRDIPLASPDNFAKPPAYWRVRSLFLPSPVLLADFLSYLLPVRTGKLPFFLLPW